MVLSCDGSWGHRRNSDQCFAAFIAITWDPTHPANGKVVDFELIRRKLVQETAATTPVQVRRRRTEALRRMVPRWKWGGLVHPVNVVGFAHDQDAKAMALVRELR
jgi:hypothetical protein